MKTSLPVLLALLASCLTAQPAAPPALSLSNGLTLDECLKLGAAQHPALAAAQAGIAAATKAVGEAQAPLYPQVDVSAGYHRWQRHAFLPSGLAVPGRPLPEIIGPLDDWSGLFSARMLLYDAGERRAGVDGAKARRAGAAAETAAVVADVRLSVQTAFYALAAAHEIQTVATQNLERAEAHQRLAAARHAAGAVPKADALRTEAEAANARLQLISAASRVRVATGRLNTAMGRPAEMPLTITLPAQTPPPPAPAEFDGLLQRAFARRPELASSENRAEAARAGVAAARAARAPKIRADGAFGWRDTYFLTDSREWQAGVAIELPLFDAGSRAHRLARSKSELVREESVLAGRRLQIRDEVWSTAVELDRTWASIAASATSVRANAESLRVTRERYERGAAVVTDLLDTQTARARAEGSLAEARWSYLVARAALDRAIGGAP